MARLRAPWPFQHVGLKVLSLGLAILIWSMVAGEETVERVVRVPLELQQFPAGLELETDPPSTADVRVRGASGALGRLSPVDMVAVLDLKGARTGRRLFHLTPDQVRVPFGVQVLQVTPTTVTLSFEKSASRKVPVVPAVDGKPAPGFLVGRITIDPAVVEIAGPESAVKTASEALTEPVSVEDARELVKESVSIGLADSSVRLTGARVATVAVQIVPATLERTIKGLPVHLRNLTTGLTAQAIPSTVGIGVRGSRESLNRLAADEVVAYVDLTGLGPGQYMLPVHADASREAGVTRADPASVQVRITQ